MDQLIAAIDVVDGLSRTHVPGLPKTPSSDAAASAHTWAVDPRAVSDTASGSTGWRLASFLFPPDTPASSRPVHAPPARLGHVGSSGAARPAASVAPQPAAARDDAGGGSYDSGTAIPSSAATRLRLPPRGANLTGGGAVTMGEGGGTCPISFSSDSSRGAGAPPSLPLSIPSTSSGGNIISARTAHHLASRRTSRRKGEEGREIGEEEGGPSAGSAGGALVAPPAAVSASSSAVVIRKRHRFQGGRELAAQDALVDAKEGADVKSSAGGEGAAEGPPRSTRSRVDPTVFRSPSTIPSACKYCYGCKQTFPTTSRYMRHVRRTCPPQSYWHLPRVTEDVKAIVRTMFGRCGYVVVEVEGAGVRVVKTTGRETRG
jgi:hypothetical protein